MPPGAVLRTMSTPRLARRPLLAVAALLLVATVVPVAWVAAHPAGVRPGTFVTAAPQTWTSGSSSASNATELTTSAEWIQNSSSVERLVIRATNLSASVVQVETWSNTTATSSNVACAPTCAAPTATATIVSRSTSTYHLVENFSTGASVAWNGTTLAALGVTGAYDEETSTSATYLSSTGPNATNGSLVTSFVTAGWIAFPSGPLGLIPWHLPNATLVGPNGSYYPVGTTWNDTAAYSVDVSLTSNLTLTGIFANESGIGYAYPVSFGAAGVAGGTASTGGPSTPPPPPATPAPVSIFPGTFSYPPAIGCQSNVTNVPPSYGNGSTMAASGPNATCQQVGPGNETAFGFSLNSEIYGAPAPGFTASYRNVSLILVGSEGPYSPGPALGGALAGSAFFGGAARGWGTVASGIGYYGVPTGGPSYGVPVSNPPPPNVNRSGSPSVDPGGPAVRPSESQGPTMGGMVPLVGAILLAAVVVAVIGVVVLARRRPPAP